MKRYPILFFVFILLSWLYPVKGETMGERSNYRMQIKEKFKQINLSDGVSKEEAIIIAQNYLIEQGEDRICDLKSAEIFGEDDPYWDKNSWHIGFNTTLKERLKSGLKWITVHIDKKTGKVIGEGGGPS